MVGVVRCSDMPMSKTVEQRDKHSVLVKTVAEKQRFNVMLPITADGHHSAFGHSAVLLIGLEFATLATYTISGLCCTHLYLVASVFLHTFPIMPSIVTCSTLVKSTSGAGMTHSPILILFKLFRS